jgi:hypothetical protein
LNVDPRKVTMTETFRGFSQNIPGESPGSPGLGPFLLPIFILLDVNLL